MDEEPAPKGWWKRRRRVIAFVTLVFHLLGFLSSIHAVMRNRTAQGAMVFIAVGLYRYFRSNGRLD